MVTNQNDFAMQDTHNKVTDHNIIYIVVFWAYLYNSKTQQTVALNISVKPKIP